jgi:anti-anti-sigma factor
LRASVDTDGATIVIRLAGSLRCATAPALREAVDAALDELPVTVLLDLAGLRADDELGLWVLPAMAGDAARRGIDLVVAAPDRALRGRLRRLGGHQLEITETVPATHGSSG